MTWRVLSAVRCNWQYLESSRVPMTREVPSGFNFHSHQKPRCKARTVRAAPATPGAPAFPLAATVPARTSRALRTASGAPWIFALRLRTVG
eukprot:3740281-Prymnesium_polylepis.2